MEAPADRRRVADRPAARADHGAVQNLFQSPHGRGPERSGRVDALAAAAGMNRVSGHCGCEASNRAPRTRSVAASDYSSHLERSGGDGERRFGAAPRVVAYSAVDIGLADVGVRLDCRRRWRAGEQRALAHMTSRVRVQTTLTDVRLGRNTKCPHAWCT